MGTFEPIQRRSPNTSTRKTSTFHRPRTSRQLASTPVPTSEQISPDQEAQSIYGTHLRFSLADIPVFPPERVNHTGLPDNLKAGVEKLSGLSMDDVHVHYNSSKPAQVQALAYTQGVNIHLGPGQEKHLAHEVWHVVQQKQGRVKPIAQTQGTAINEDQHLEREAHSLGAKAAQEEQAVVDEGKQEQVQGMSNAGVIQRLTEDELRGQSSALKNPTEEEEATLQKNVKVVANRLKIEPTVEALAKQYSVPNFVVESILGIEGFTVNQRIQRLEQAKDVTTTRR
jgi:hypothetical protein